jgi:DNA-binding PadR family transcriptional regulator
MYALKDGLIRWVREEPGSGPDFYGTYTLAVYQITQEGREFIKKWLSANEELE